MCCYCGMIRNIFSSCPSCKIIHALIKSWHCIACVKIFCYVNVVVVQALKKYLNFLTTYIFIRPIHFLSIFKPVPFHFTDYASVWNTFERKGEQYIIIQKGFFSQAFSIIDGKAINFPGVIEIYFCYEIKTLNNFVICQFQIKHNFLSCFYFGGRSKEEIYTTVKCSMIPTLTSILFPQVSQNSRFWGWNGNNNSLCVSEYLYIPSCWNSKDGNQGSLCTREENESTAK